MRARLAFTLVLLAAAAGLVWWILGSRWQPPAEVADASADGPSMEEISSAGLGAVDPRAKKVEAIVAKGKCSIVGIVRRMGVPVAARVDVYILSRAAAGIPEDWRSDGIDAELPATGAMGVPPHASAVAGADGAFTVPSLDPADYEVVGIASDGARASVSVSFMVDGSVLEARLNIRGGPETLRGKTLKADGTPWKGHVSSFPFGAWGENSAYGLSFVATGDDGSFTLAGLERGRVSVVAFVDKSVRVVFRPVPVPYPAGELVLVVDVDFRVVTGRVLDDRNGQALVGASVAASAWNAGERSQVKTRSATDAEGRFHLPVPAKGVSMTATQVGYAPSSRNVGESQSEVEFRLVKTARIFGRVTSDIDGAPIGGVPVYAAALGDDVSAGSRGVTGPDGRYEITEVRPGSVMVCAFGGGWYSKELLHARLQGFNSLAVVVPADASVTVDLVATRGASATGKVTTVALKPVAGATVGWSGASTGGADFSQFEWVVAAARTATASDGTFACDTLIPGLRYTFHATASGETDGTAGPLEATAEKPLTVEIKLPEGIFVEATVLDDEGGKPIAGATVQCWFSSSFGSNTRPGVTGADGKARVGPLPPGDLWAMAQAPGAGNGNWQQLKRKEGVGGPVEVTLTIHRSLDIRGRIRYADGTLVDDRNLFLTMTGANVNWSTNGVLDGGAFEFNNLVPGSYRLEIKIDASQPAVVGATLVAGDENVALILPGGPAKRLTLTVLDGNGKAIPTAKFFFMGMDNGASGDTIFEGKVKLPAVATEGWIEIYKAAGPAGGALPWAPVTVGPLPVGTEAKEVRLEAEKRIEGFVHGPDGRGVRGVRIQATPMERVKAFEGNDTYHDAALSDAEGRFRLGRLWSGDYKLTVETSDAFAPSEPRIVPAGSLAVDVALLSGLVALLPVQDWQGRPLAQATVSATIEGRQTVRAITDASGIARLVGLDRERLYRLDVEPPNEMPEVMGLSIEEWKPSEEPVRVPRAAGVLGVVRDRDGRAAGGARVTLVGADNNTNTTQAAGDGTFRFLRVAPGEYRLFATAGGEPRRTSSMVTVVAGGPDVALVLEPAIEMSIRFGGWPLTEGDTWVPLHFDGSPVVLEWGRIEAGGLVTFRNVHPDSRYAIYLRIDTDPPRIAFRRGIVPASGELRIPMEAGRTIRGRLVAPRGTQQLGVSISQDGLDLGADVDAEGRYEIKGLPDGTFRLNGYGSLDGAPVTGSVEAAAGGVVDIELRKK